MYSYNNIRNEDIDCKFSIPRKTESGVYEALLETPITFQLPIMDVYPDTQDDSDTLMEDIVAQTTLTPSKAPSRRYPIKYLVDVNDLCCNKMLDFFYKLDSIALDSVEKYATSWFGKHVEKEHIVERYVPPYDTDENENVFLRVYGSAKQKLKSQKYSNHYCVISIEGLQFYKKRFVYLIHISKIVKLKDTKINDEVIDSLADYDDVETVHKTGDHHEPFSALVPSYTHLLLKQWGTKKSYARSAPSCHKSMDAESDRTHSSLSRVEIESLIDQTKQELNECFTAAEKASRVAENLRLRALQKANDLKNIESMLLE